MTVRHGAARVRASAEVPRLADVSQLALEARMMDGLVGALDYLPVGAILVDGGGRILLRNRHAARCLDLGAGVHERHGQLRCDFVDDTSRLRRGVELLVRRERRAPLALSARRADGGRPLELLLRASGGEAVTVFIADRERPTGFDAELAKQLYRLSEREAEVAEAVVAGHTLLEIAASLHVEKETVRSHLKQIFSKTQTARQADLVRLFSTGLFGLWVGP